MMRRPTSRETAWQHWRDRINGIEREVSDAPQPGWYKARRQGQWTAIQIDLHQVVDDDGYLTEPEGLVAFVGRDLVIYEESKIGEIWLRCCGNPISEEEAERLLRAPVVSDLTRQVIV